MPLQFEGRRDPCGSPNAADGATFYYSTSNTREELGKIDVGDLLPQVKVPTLVLHRRDVVVVPFEEGRRLAALIPGARFVPLEGRNHLLLESEPAWTRFVTEIRQFLRAR